MGRALFVGRFQPFHHGHYEVVKRLLKDHSEVVIVIGSAEESRTQDNPFTAGERIQMIRLALSPAMLRRSIIVPVRDINDHARWVSHVKSYVPDFDTVYTNNRLVARLFGEARHKVAPVAYFDRGKKEGRLIRKLMKEGNNEWKKHVSRKIAALIKKLDIKALMPVLED